MKKHFIKMISMLLLAAALLSCTAGAFAEEDSEIIDGILSCFMPLTEIPRQSHHEEKISEYLFNWAQERGFSPARDEANNVIFDVSATEGMEDAPLTILQGHMDMVVAVADGKEFDPLNDSISVINDGKTITADGTSLGADDGIGVATALYFAENNKCHGPIRIIFTTNEEDGLTGATALTADVTAGAEYVINLDSESAKEVTTSAAAGIVVYFSMPNDTASPKKDHAMKLEIKGLRGGHSGLDIHLGRLNAIKAVGTMLKNVEEIGIDFELAGLTGGSAKNAIPVKATACIVVDEKDIEAVKASVEAAKEKLKEDYAEIEPDMTVIIEDCDMPKLVLSEASKNNAVYFVNDLFDGVNTMSEYVEGLVESSSNLGLISIAAGEPSTAESYVRSSDAEKLEILTGAQISLAEECGFSAKTEKTSEAWPVNPNSKLLETVKTAYKAVTGEDIGVLQVHAGLECGTFSKLNNKLDIVSIGCDVLNPHTVNEVCNLTTIPTVYRVLENVLANIG